MRSASSTFQRTVIRSTNPRGVRHKYQSSYYELSIFNDTGRGSRRPESAGQHPVGSVELSRANPVGRATRPYPPDSPFGRSPPSVLLRASRPLSPPRPSILLISGFKWLRRQHTMSSYRAHHGGGPIGFRSSHALRSSPDERSGRHQVRPCRIRFR